MAAKLTQNEKYVIQGRLHDGDTIKDIAKSIGRQSKTIQNFVDNELDAIQETIAKAQTEHIMEEAKKPAKKPKRKPKNTGFINKTGGDNDGIAVSTHSASSQSDEYKKSYPSTMSRSAKGNIYEINEDRIKE